MLPITSKCNRLDLTAICLHTSYIFAVPMKEKSAENVIQAYLSSILAHKGGSVAIISDTGTEFKNKVLNELCDQLGIKRLFSNLFHLQSNVKVENVRIFFKKTLTKFLTIATSNGMNSFHLHVIAITYFQAATATESLFFLFGMRSSRRIPISP